MKQNLKIVPPVATWGDRSSLLPKRMAYAMSFDVTLNVDAAGPFLALLSASSENSPKKHALGAIYHALDQSSVVTADGSVREVPDSLTVVHADAQLTADLGDEANSIAGSILFKNEIGNVLSMTYTGTLASNRGSGDPLGVGATGTVFIATKQASAVPSLRWLAQRQLFGVGRMKTKGARQGQVGPAKLLKLSFDLYTAA